MNQRFIRRNRVDERLALAIAAGSAFAALFGGSRPTGTMAVDVVLVFVAVVAVVWASASAAWWAVAAASGIAAVMAFEPIAAALGALGFLAGLDVGTWRRDQTIVRATVGGVAVNVFLRSELDTYFGLSAAVGVVTCTALFVLGFMRRPSRVRRPVQLALSGVGGLLVVGVLTVGLSATSARPDLSDGATTARQGVTALNAGDYERAATLFEQASVRFSSADGHLGGPLALPGRLVPVVAQNLRAGADLSAVASEATAEAASALRQIDIERLTVSGGVIDLDVVRSVEAPLRRVNAALTELRLVLDDVDSQWLAGPVQDRLRDINDEFADNEPRLSNAIEAVRLAPQMLGADGLRRYLLLFTSPAEARGVGGFVGSYVVLEIDGGRLTVGDFGRTQELNQDTAGSDCSACPAEMLEAYGRFGFTTGEGGTTGNVLFSNVTMPAHFPNIAAAIDIIYPQGRGEALDGVMVLDPFVVQALMKYSGPIEVPELDITVRPNAAAQFLLEDQYILAEDRGVRVEALDALGRGAIAAILDGDLPDPTVIARDFGPLVAERRLLMYTDDPGEQVLLDRIGMLGSIPAIDARDGGFSVSVTNSSANKIDVFLDREVSVRIDGAGDQRRLIANVRLTNNAPTSGLPDYVIGNSIGLPEGSSRLFVTFYGPPLLENSVEVGGGVIPVEALPEGGWTAYSNYFDFDPAESREFELTFSLPSKATDDEQPDTPTLWEQPLSSRSEN